QCRVASGPADADEKHMTSAGDGEKRRGIEARQEMTVIVHAKVVVTEHLGQTLAKQVADAWRLLLDEDELTSTGHARDAWEHLIVFRPLFVQGLTAPIDRCVIAQSKIDMRIGRAGERLAIYRQVGQPNQSLRVVILPVRRLHQLAAEIIIHSRI